MSLEWCKKSDAGLPRPDQVLFLDLQPEEAKRRGQFGAERYEKEEFQKRVYENFQLLKDDVWKVGYEIIIKIISLETNLSVNEKYTSHFFL